MKITITNDLHAGVRSDSQIFLDYQEKFFENVFFPYVRENGIKNHLDLGDLFDRRKYINFKTLQRFEDMFLIPMQKLGIEIDIIAGNHDVYYKDRNDTNSLRLIANKYDNIIVHDVHPIVKTYGNYKIGLVPWISKQNYEECLDFIQNTDANILAGHFEINGFDMIPGVKCSHGLSKKLFKRFDDVWSGHFHTKSRYQNIAYFGTQYEMTWNDYGNGKYFHVFDDNSGELEPVKNPYTIFEKIFYNDKKNDYKDFDFQSLNKKYVKVMVVKRQSLYDFDLFLNKIQDAEPADLKVIEDSHDTDSEDVDFSDAQDTMTILEQYIDGLDVSLKKDKIKGIIRELHRDSLSLE